MVERICAIIVTHNRKEHLRQCLLSVRTQTRSLDHILIVDNASTDGTPEMVKVEFPEVEIFRLRENLGGAGGFHEGIRRAYEEGFDWLWLMDDDAYPEVDALAALLEHKNEAEILVPVLKDSSGRIYGVGYWKGGRYVSAHLDPVAGSVFYVELFPFVGPLIHRRVITEVGLPRAEFFIWFDDVEYALRIRKKGKKVLCVSRSVITHDSGQFRTVSFMGRSKLRPLHPPWKTYYSTRNRGWTVLRSAYAEPRLQSIMAYLIDNFRQCLGDLLYERDRWVRISLRCLGIWHAVIGRLGKRYP